MGYDNRQALPDGFELSISDAHTGGQYSVTIQGEIGRGGNCIVYSGLCRGWIGEEQIEKNVVIKEFYPISLSDGIKRDPDMQFTVDTSIKDRFDGRLSNFCNGLAKHVMYANKHSDKALPPVTVSGNALGTFYAVSDPGQGKTLKILLETERDQLTLTDALKICISICDAVSLIHSGGRENDCKATNNLFLDCKPDNIFVNGYNAYLFDFDTVQPYGKLTYYSYSEGWSAPEQIYNDDRGYADVRRIGYHTDIFSIGAVLFSMLTGKNPYEAGLEKIQKDFDPASVTLKDETDALKDGSFLSGLKRTIGKTLQADPDLRKKDFGSNDAAQKLREDFEQLLSLAENAPYRRGFDDTREELQKAKDSITQSIEKQSLKEQLFGNKKRMATTLGIILLLIVAGIAASAIGSGIASKMGKKTTASEIDQEMNKYLLLKLSNANHQYEVGLENWRRLDYVRAERDIKASLDDISEETSQAQLEVAKINNSLGCLYLDMGRYAEAYDYLNSAYVTFNNSLGAGSIAARAVRAGFSRYYYNTGKPDEALAETQYILDNSDPKKEKSVIAAVMHLRAMIYDSQGRYDDALSLYSDVLDMYKDISDNGKMSEQLANYANDPGLSQNEKDYYTNSIKWIIQTYNNIAKVRIHKGEYSEAATAANTGLEMSLSNIYIGKRNITTSGLYMNLATAKGYNGETASALDDIDLAMRIQRNLFDFEDVFPGLVEVYDVYGNLLMMKNDREGAYGYYKDAVELAVNSFGVNHPDTASAYDAMGKYYVSAGDIDSAVDYLKKAIEIRKNILAEDHPDTAGIYYDLAMALKASGNEPEAEKCLNAAARICEKWDIEGLLKENIDKELR